MRPTSALGPTTSTGISRPLSRVSSRMLSARISTLQLPTPPTNSVLEAAYEVTLNAVDHEFKFHRPAYRRSNVRPTTAETRRQSRHRWRLPTLPKASLKTIATNFQATTYRRVDHLLPYPRSGPTMSTTSKSDKSGSSRMVSKAVADHWRRERLSTR